MNIAMIHYKVGGTDGVSLEMDKWKRVFEDMGHTVYLCGGDLGTADGVLIEELYHHRDDAKRLTANTFWALEDYADEAAYRDALYERVAVIEGHLRDFIKDKQIDFLVPQNVWSVAVNPPVAIALANVMREFNIPALAHNHDFYFERNAYALTCKTAVDLADKYLPPRDPLAHHVVINSLAQQALLERKGVAATVVPNVFDFDGPGWDPDDYNADFRKRIGLGENDIFILQATRIVGRKGIELAVDFVRELDTPERRAVLKERGLYDGRSFSDDSRIVLVLAGYAQDDLAGYIPNLKEKIARAGIDVLFVEDVIEARRQVVDGEKHYSLWDSYVYADFVTYPSLWEGWGNQFLEALRAKLPVLLFEYPVYERDIKDKGFSVVSLGSTVSEHDDLGLAQVAPDVMAAAADQALDLLSDPAAYQAAVEHNFALGQKHYSMAALREYLTRLMADFDL